MTEKITAWSFSRLQDWRQCPLKAKLKHVDKLKEPGNKAMERGNVIDKMAEAFTRPDAKKKVCPNELKPFEEEFRLLQKRKTFTQAQWAFTSSWTPTDWFAKDAWCRIKTDLCFTTEGGKTLIVVDHKTGKINEAHHEQLKLYSLGGLLQFTDVETVDPRLWYLDHGKEVPEEATLYSRSDVPTLKKYWEKQVRPMLADSRFPPKANQYCGYCHFRKANGGPCPL